MKINNSKIVMGILLSIVVWCFYALFAMHYEPVSVTGSDLETIQVATGAIVKVEHVGNYHIKIDSCDSFSVKIDGEIILEGVPQDLAGTRCANSYYKIENDQFNADSVEIVSGTPYIKLSADIPLGMAAGFTEDTRKHDLGNGGVITFWIWLLVMVIVFVPNWE